MRFISEALTKVVGQRALPLRGSAPTIFFVGGIVAAVTSTVLACRATLKLEETLDEFIDDNVVENGIVNDEITRINNPLRAGFAIVRLYAPALVVGSASIVLLSKSHSTLMKRNAALGAAYTALDEGFQAYRGRVIEKYGQEEDDRLRYGHETEKVKTPGGKTVKVDRFNPETGASIYSVFFDEYNPNWSKDPEINKLFLRSQQNYLNDLLHARGHLFLNEVYDSLGFNHSQAGSVVGWILSPDGDNYVDLGVFNGSDAEEIRDFVNGREGSVLLDFNVDGLIYNRIPNEPRADVRWQRTRWARI